jgi:hypothetical protein
MGFDAYPQVNRRARRLPLWIPAPASLQRSTG